ncbi:MAG: HNH endonuclease [Acidobacteriia bacterium]|nr:HNH endonuclease [Terriglobia bacterium]
MPAWRPAAGFSARSDRKGFVNRIRPKTPRLRLDPKLYELLRKQVLRRDGWQCQVCGTRQDLQVHHKQLRSQQGSDEDLNLITLCAGCHEGLHRWR